MSRTSASLETSLTADFPAPPQLDPGCRSWPSGSSGGGALMSARAKRSCSGNASIPSFCRWQSAWPTPAACPNLVTSGSPSGVWRRGKR